MPSMLSANMSGTCTVNVQGTASGAAGTGITGAGHKAQCQPNGKDAGEEERPEGKAGRTPRRLHTPESAGGKRTSFGEVVTRVSCPLQQGSRDPYTKSRF